MKLNYLLCGVCILLITSFVHENQAQGVVEEFVIGESPIIDVAWSPNGHFLAVSDANEIQMIQVSNYDLVNSIPVSSQAIAWNVDSSQIAAYSLAENAILIFDAQTSQLEYSIQGIAEIKEIDGFIFVNDLTWNECGLFAVTGNIDLFLWGNSEYLQDTVRLSGHADVVSNVIIGEDCKFVVTRATDSTVKVWDISSGETILSFDSRRAIAVRGDTITYISPENAIVNYTLSQAYFQTLYDLDSDEHVWFLDWSYSDNILAYSTSREVKVLVLSSDTSIPVYLSPDYINKVSWHPYRPLMAIVDSSGTMSVWNLEEILTER